MFKRKWIVLISVVLSVALLCSAFWFFVIRDNTNNSKSQKESSNITITEKDNWLTIDTISKLKALAEKNDISVEYETEDAYVRNLPFGDGSASYIYKFDKDNNIIGLRISQILVSSLESGETFTMEEIDAQEFKKRIYSVFDWISEFLNVQIENNFYIISIDGDILPVEEIASYQHIIEGSAYLELRILDIDNSVWVLNIENVGNYNMISCIFEHCSANSDAAKIPCNVAIEQ